MVAARPLAASGPEGADPRPQRTLSSNAGALRARLRAGRFPVDRRQRRLAVGARLPAPWLAERPPVAVVCNFTPEPRLNYRVGLPYEGHWREAINSDAGIYGGSNVGNFGGVTAQTRSSHGFPASATLTLPPLSALYLVFSPPDAAGSAS